VLSPTVRLLEREQVTELMRVAFGAHVEVVDHHAMTGGGFAGVWRVDLAEGPAATRSVVLKVSPPVEVPLLRYEHDLLAAEAAYLRLVRAKAPQVPVPSVLHHSRSILDGEWLVTQYLPGTPLTKQSGAAPSLVREELGSAMAHLHTVSGPRHGYTGARPHGSTWRAAFTAMTEALLADAHDWQVELPASPQRLRDLLGRDPQALDLVRRPALVHFDLWDDNVLTTTDPQGNAHLSGLVDGERHLYGDPLIDFVTPAMYRRIEDEADHPFLRGYAQAVHAPVVLDEPVRRRLTLYRTHLYLLMTIEMPSRGMSPTNRPARHRRLADLLDAELTELGRW
jgi:Ser/Thr protein kinase RdoA (MazF antagonist)